MDDNSWNNYVTVDSMKRVSFSMQLQVKTCFYKNDVLEKIKENAILLIPKNLQCLLANLNFTTWTH